MPAARVNRKQGGKAFHAHLPGHGKMISDFLFSGRILFLSFRLPGK